MPSTSACSSSHCNSVSGDQRTRLARLTAKQTLMSFLKDVRGWSLSPGIWFCERLNRDDGIQATLDLLRRVHPSCVLQSAAPMILVQLVLTCATTTLSSSLARSTRAPPSIPSGNVSQMKYPPTTSRSVCGKRTPRGTRWSFMALIIERYRLPYVGCSCSLT